MRFAKDDVIECENKSYTILDLLGEGGQGEVYLVDCGGEKLAFKYYKDPLTAEFRYNLKNNIAKGSPAENFLWPKQYIEFDDGYSGYFMDLRPKNYVSFVSYLSGAHGFKSRSLLLNWCIEVVKCFKLLHEKGFSYQDLNDGSFFFDPDTGKALICDNDNVTADKKNLGILGKMRYMAPEIVRGDMDPFTHDRQMPDMHSDRFSLAIILFLALCLGNPFEGECLKKYQFINEEAELEMYGTHPVYIYNKNDSSNRPIRGYHTAVLKRYPYLPSYIKDAFHKTFVDGLTDRENGRTTELEWIKALCRYRDELMTCSCGAEYIYGFAENKPNDQCPYCHQATRRFCVLHIGRNLVLLEPGKKLYESHLDKYSSNYNSPIAEVVANKKNPNLWGIKLNLASDVLIKDATGQEKTIASQGVVPIINHLKIKFNDAAIGEIICEN